LVAPGHLEVFYRLKQTMPVSAIQNQVCRNRFWGRYDESQKKWGKRQIKEYAEKGLLNIVVHCFGGTTPEHIKAIAEVVGKGYEP